MIDQDRTDADLEALLRATFSSEARNQVSDARPVPPFPATTRVATVHPLRRRWTGITLVAAAVAAIVVGATVIGDEAMNSDRAPRPAGTTGAPTTTITQPTTSPDAGPTSPVPTTASSTPSTVTTKRVTFGTVSMTVPSQWGVRPVGGPTFGYVHTCLSPDGDTSTAGDDPTPCTVVVRVQQPGAQPVGAALLEIPAASVCGSADADPGYRMLSADEVTIAGGVADHRTWSSRCAPGSSIETWTVPTVPVVQFTRIGPATDTTRIAAVRAAVLSASPGPRSALRGVDLGYPTAVRGAVVSIDRITVVGSEVVNNNPATYDYPIAAGTPIYWTQERGNGGTMTLAQLRSEVAGGTVPGVPPITDLAIRVLTDGSQATYVALSPRSTLT